MVTVNQHTTIEVRRTGPTAVVTLTLMRHGLAAPVTRDEFHVMVTYLAQADAVWQRDRNTIPVDYYTILGVFRGATATEIRRAYRTLAKKYHPDTSSDETTLAMTQLNDAYAVLGDPQQRQQYDRTL